MLSNLPIHYCRDWFKSMLSIMFLNIIGLILKICLNSSVQKNAYLLQNPTTFFQLSFLNASYY